MLVGGSGFGKTTLAEQWAPRDGRSLGWFRAHRSAADVAVVARGLSTAAAVSVAGAGRRMLERLTVTEDPEREAILLAEMLVEDLQDWPDEGWIAIDDYQHLAVSAASEAFVQTIVQQTPVRMLLASRVRPSWVSARSILDGKVLEIPQAALAMGAEEIEEVLEGARTELTAGLLALAGGWPAVVGLAGMAPDAPYPDADRPETLYEFFAEELYRGLDPTVQTGLAVLAAMPLVDRELAETILGPERAARVCDEALSLGILEEREDRLELHPLVRSFFEAHESLEMSALPAATGEALTLYRRRREWDSAFELVREHDLHADFAGVLGDGREVLPQLRVQLDPLVGRDAPRPAGRGVDGAGDGAGPNRGRDVQAVPKEGLGRRDRFRVSATQLTPRSHRHRNRGTEPVLGQYLCGVLRTPVP